MVQRHRRFKQAPRGAKGNTGDRYFEIPRQKPKPVENLQAARMQEARARISGLEKSIVEINGNPFVPLEEKERRINRLRKDIERIKYASPEVKRAELLEEVLRLDAERFKADEKRSQECDKRLRKISAELGIKSRSEAIQEAKRFGLKIPDFH